MSGERYSSRNTSVSNIASCSFVGI